MLYKSVQTHRVERVFFRQPLWEVISRNITLSKECRGNFQGRINEVFIVLLETEIVVCSANVQAKQILRQQLLQPKHHLDNARLNAF